jgi:hypothetical protein
MNALVIGVRRQGKSTVSIAVAQSQSKTTVIFDPNEQFRNFPAIDVNAVEPALVAAAEDQRGRHVIRVVPEGGEKEIQDSFGQLTDVLWGWEDLTLIIDEASTVQAPSIIHDNLNRILRRAHASFHTIQTSHRITDFHRLSRSVSLSDVFAFRTVQSGDIKRMGEEVDGRLVAILPTLGLYEVAHWWIRPGGDFAISVWRDPEEWYIDIGRDKGDQKNIDATGEKETQERLFRPDGDTRSDDDPMLRRVKDAR